MILTITANAALDRVLFLPKFHPTTTMRTEHVVESVGGKGFDTSVVLQTLGAPNLAMGFMAGMTGRQLQGLLDRYGIRHDLIWVEGDTRIAHVIVETDLHRHSHIITHGFAVEPKEQEEFFEHYCQQVRQADWVVAAGSLPNGLAGDFYFRLIEIAHREGAHQESAKVLIDCPGEPALQAIPARPDILKMNRSEFASTFGCEPGDTAGLEQQVRDILMGEDLPAMVITAGEDGILAVTAEHSFLAGSPRQQAVNAAGAGDAVSAVLAWRLGSGDSWPEALRRAAATSAAVVLTEGTADCRLEDIERIYPQVTVRKIR